MKNKYEVKNDYVIIFLSGKNNKNFETLLDIEDFENIKEIDVSWNASWREDSKSFYVSATKYIGTFEGKPKYKILYLHREIFGNLKRTQLVDHVDSKKTLDNRRNNLRITDHSDNLKNRQGKNKNNKSGYRNVCMMSGKWRVQLMVEDKRILFEEKFTDVDEAGKFAEKMRKKYYGDFAGLGE